MVLMNGGLLSLRERIGSVDQDVFDAVPLDDFVRRVDSMGPQVPVRVTKTEASFMKQLVKKAPR